jgi:site-specific recombinase XerD
VFRHTALSRLAQSGMSLYEVQHIAGHKDVRTTTIYSHLIMDQVTKKARDVLNQRKC